MVALIPARGGSKGLPKKNLKLLKGLPLISYTIIAAKKAKCIDKVIVSTDDEGIASISREYGAEVPFIRPTCLAEDDSPAIDVYLHAIEELEKTHRIVLDDICVLLPTCPLRTWVDIDKAYSIYIMKKADSVISFTQESHPIYWNKFIDTNGRFVNIFDEDYLENRQKLRLSYYPNGGIYIFKTTLLRQRKYYSDKSYAYIMPRERSVDIDTQNDFAYAEFLLNLAQT